MMTTEAVVSISIAVGALALNLYKLRTSASKDRVRDNEANIQDVSRRLEALERELAECHAARDMAIRDKNMMMGELIEERRRGRRE